MIITTAANDLGYRFRNVNDFVVLVGYCDRATNALTLDDIWQGELLGNGEPLPIKGIVSIICERE